MLSVLCGSHDMGSLLRTPFCEAFYHYLYCLISAMLEADAILATVLFLVIAIQAAFVCDLCRCL